MTIADKTEISNLINSAKTMKECVDNLKRVYNDKKIVEYAKNAIENCFDVMDYIKDTINENISLFFDISKPIKLIDGSGTNWTYLRDGQPLTFNYKDGLNIEVYPINKEYVSNFVRTIGSASFVATSINAFKVKDVFPRVHHDTKHKDYNLGCFDDLVFNNRDHIKNFDCGEYDCETWKKIYSYAKNTRAKTEFLIRAFKSQLEVINSNMKAEATKREMILEQVKNVEDYKKVGF